MSNLWTRSETVGPPSILTIEYKIANAQNQTEQRSVTATSTTFGSSTSEYSPLTYTDRDGKTQVSEVLIRKTDTTRTTIAAVSPGYVAWRLSKSLGLPGGAAISENITTSTYKTTVDGPVLVTEVSEQYVSMAQFAGGLQLEEWGNFRPSGSELVLSYRTIRRMDYAKTSDGRDVTRTLTERYIAAAESSEWKNYTAKRGKDIKSLISQAPEVIGPLVRSLTPLVYEGTEVQIETGRVPVPSKPSDEDIARQDITDGAGDTPSDATPEDLYGNNSGWTGYIPGGTFNGNWQDYNKDSNNDGIPDWNDYVPQSWEDYDTDSDNDGIFDWEAYVPQDWSDYDRDSDGDGLPDWKDYVPTTWQEFDQDSDNDGIPDWAPYVPTDWTQFTGDTDGNGVPDWAPYVPDPINWQNLNKDSNNDGIPDWAPYVPQSWEDFDQDSDNDGIPDWEKYIPKDWTDYNKDSDNDGFPDWKPYVPIGNDFDADSDNDGVPDWEPYVPTGPDDFDTKDSDYTTTETEVSNDKVLTGVVLFNGQAFNPDDTTVTASYDMPFAPDDYFEYVKGIRKLIPGGATAAAEAFGRTESALDVGHAYGQNIVTGWNEAPTLDLSPLYIQIAGIEGAFLMDSCSYAWGPEGMVVSADLMLLGVSGYYGASAPATSWLRLPVAPTGLQQVAAGTAGVGIKANSIPLPADFSSRNPAPVLAALPNTGADRFALFRTSQTLVGPTLELEQTRLATGPLLIAQEFPYSLTLAPETAAIATGPSIAESTVVAPPAAVITVAALAPAVVSGASVAVPAAAVALVGLAPIVSSGASVPVPAAGVMVAGVPPDLVGRQRIQILVPPAALTVGALTPAVVSGASVAVPAAGVTVAGVAPDVVTPPTDPFFSSVSLLLRMDGSNGSTTFTDLSTNALSVTAFGNARVTTTDPKFGTGALTLDGAEDYLSVAPNAALQLGTGSFTVECWVYANSGNTNDGLFTFGGISSGLAVAIEGGLWKVTMVGSGTFTHTAALTTGTWAHLAVARSGTDLRFFVNGVSAGTVTNSTNLSGNALNIGYYYSPSFAINAKVDEFRVTKGVARYTANFTPPTAPFPNA